MSSRLPRVVMTAALALALAGCAGVGAEPESAPATRVPVETAEPSALPAETSAPSAETSSPPEREPIALPDCAALLTMDHVRDVVNDAQVEGPELYVADEWEGLLGPAARQAYVSSGQTVTCTYGIPNTDGAFVLTVATIDAEVAASLVSALESSDEFEHTTRGDIALFSRGFPDGIGIYLGYAFVGEVWVIVHGTMVDSVTSVALAADAAGAVLAYAR